MSDLRKLSEALEKQGKERRKVFIACLDKMTYADENHPLSEEALDAYELFVEFINNQTTLARGYLRTIEQVETHTNKNIELRIQINKLFTH